MLSQASRIFFEWELLAAVPAHLVGTIKKSILHSCRRIIIYLYDSYDRACISFMSSACMP